MLLYTITTTRHQIRIETSDGSFWLFQKSEEGVKRASACVTRLEALGYRERK